MARTQTPSPSMIAAVGYAADERGNGIAYVRAQTATGEQLARIPFRMQRRRELGGRDVGYGAVGAALHALREWGVRRIQLLLEEPELVDAIAGGRDVPPEMVLPYVRLRCALNAFDSAAVALGAQSDLTQRARAEIAMHAAA